MSRATLLAVVLAAAMLMTSGCYRYDVVISTPEEPRPNAQVRRHVWGHLVEDNTINLDPFCDGEVARLYQRSPWYSGNIASVEIYCRPHP